MVYVVLWHIGYKESQVNISNRKNLEFPFFPDVRAKVWACCML